MAPPDPQPTWQPISRLSLIAEMITGMADEAVTQLDNLCQAEGRPGALDNATVNWVMRVYSQQQDDLWLYEEQLRRWQTGQLTSTQCTQIVGLTDRLAGLRTNIAAILGLAERLKPLTIESLLAHSDEEFGHDALLGKRTPRGRPKA
jgi:hypothetical protein